jgi:hypothetical protein
MDLYVPKEMWERGAHTQGPFYSVLDFNLFGD